MSEGQGTAGRDATDLTRAARDAEEAEALVVDRYLDSLLAAAERHAQDAPAAADLDPALRAAVRRLRRDLVRVHPSFRFEERLARRLAEAAAAVRATDVGDDAPGATDLPTAPWQIAVAGGDRGPSRRPLLIRGAMASAALSLAGAAIVVARRRARPLPPMSRAARAAHRASRVARRRAGHARPARLA